VAPFEFGSYSIAQQAFLNAVNSTIGGMQDIGIYGLMGLSFDFASGSPINQQIESIYGPDATWGRSVLQNIFMQNPTEPNFIAIALSRTGDLEETDGGSFTIGEYLPQYADVANQTKLSQYPTGGDRWTTLLEGAYVDGTAIAVVSNITGVPSGQGQTLLDTGNPAAIFPVAMYDAIYSSIPGSALLNVPGTRIWVIPCNTTTSLEFVFGGERFPVHPLDLSTITAPLAINGQQYVACVAALQGADGYSDGFDISLGDTFLRNVYSVFDFGDYLRDGSTSDPYMQLLSTLDPATAISQVATIRGQTMANLPPELDPATFVGLLISNGTGTDPTSAAASPNPTSSSDASEGLSSVDSDSTKTKSGVDLAIGDDQTVTIDGSLVKKYGLIIICLLGANVLIGVVLIVFGVLACVRRGSSRKNATRASAPVYVPVKSMEQDERYSDLPQKRYSES
jgi:saccharopepsin